MGRTEGAYERLAPATTAGWRSSQDQSGQRPVCGGSDRLGAKLPRGEPDAQFHRGARRSSERWQLLADVAVLDPEVGDGTLLNASRGGMRIACEGHVPVGRECTVRVRTERRETTERCRVVWARELPDGWLLGLAFAE